MTLGAPRCRLRYSCIARRMTQETETSPLSASALNASWSLGVTLTVTLGPSFLGRSLMARIACSLYVPIVDTESDCN